jgi:DNA-binding CsgD family transcriptional regulator
VRKGNGDKSNGLMSVGIGASAGSVEAHKANAMRKLDMCSRIDIVRFAILQG